MCATRNAIRPVWPVDPDRWNQTGDSWAAEMQILIQNVGSPDCLVAVKLPDGRLVRYDLDGLWRFPREWQPRPTPVLDYQI